MNKIIITLILGIGGLFFLAGCADDVHVFHSDYDTPFAPRGIYSITADEAVYLFWDANDERDLKEYRVYRKEDGDDYYERIATVKVNEYVDWGLRNGHTYLYTITARDRDGNESDFSEIAYDTPRPEGYDQIIHDYHRYPGLSGYDLSKFEVTRYDDDDADIYLDYDDYYEVYFLCVTDEATDIQDFGYTDDLDDVNWSPSEGWSSIGWVEVIPGHSYIIWTRDDHYAKLRVSGSTYSYGIVFDWAYQVDEGNQELAPRPKHAENFLKALAIDKSGQL